MQEEVLQGQRHRINGAHLKVPISGCTVLRAVTKCTARMGRDRKGRRRRRKKNTSSREEEKGEGKREENLKTTVKHTSGATEGERNMPPYQLESRETERNYFETAAIEKEKEFYKTGRYITWRKSFA